MNVVICDDELQVLEKLETILKGICSRNNMSLKISKYQSGDRLLFNADEVIKDTDVLLLDVMMPGTDGIQTARRLRELGFEGELIYLSASRDAVFQAFDVRANNYILKTTATQERIEEVFLKAVKSAAEKKDEYLLLTGVGEHRNVPIDRIRYFEIRGRIVTVYYDDTEFEFVSTMGKLENLLWGRGFMRISRSCIIALRHVESFAYESVTTTRGETLPVGRKYYKALKEAMVKSEKNEIPLSPENGVPA